MRLIVARCEVTYTGRLTAVLPEATRLLLLKSDGSVLVHSDAGGYKPENWDCWPPRRRGTRGRIRSTRTETSVKRLLGDRVR
jgi:RecB family endonuclease NucS